MESNILIILGMHRSGTSLTANWLSQCGLSIGKDLLGVGIGNQLGHFEDVDFYDFHMKIMKAHGSGFHPKKLTFSERDRKKAASIIQEKNKQNKQWSWKEPRTCLFLDLWHPIVPYAKVIVLYRHYDFVVDSLVRREFKNNKEVRTNRLKKLYHSIFSLNLFLKKTYLNFLDAWTTYNQQILGYIAQKNPEDVLVFNIDTFKEKSIDIRSYLINTLFFELDDISLESIYKKDMMQSKSAQSKIETTRKKEAHSIFEQLERQEQISLKRLEKAIQKD